MERDQRPRVARWHPRLASVCLLLLRILPGSAYDDKWREPEAEPVGLLHHTGEPTAPVSWWAEAGRGSEESSRGGSTPPQLTALGLGVKRVLVVALVGGVCVDDGW